MWERLEFEETLIAQKSQRHSEREHAEKKQPLWVKRFQADADHIQFLMKIGCVEGVGWKERMLVVVELTGCMIAGICFA